MASLKNRITDIYDGLTDREQMLLKVAGGVLSILAVVLVTLLFNQSLQATQTEIDEYEQALNTLAEAAPQLRAQAKQGDKGSKAAKFSAEKLENNDVELTSFMVQHLTALGVEEGYTYTPDQMSLGKDSDDSSSSLMKHELDLDIDKIEFSTLMDLLERVELSDKPVVIERISLNRHSRTKGTVQAVIVVSTFKKKGEG